MPECFARAARGKSFCGRRRTMLVFVELLAETEQVLARLGHAKERATLTASTLCPACVLVATTMQANALTSPQKDRKLLRST